MVVSTLDELRAACADPAADCGGVLVEARDGNGDSTRPFIEAIVGGDNRIPVIGYADGDGQDADAIADLLEAGVHEMVLRGVDDMVPFLALKFARADETRAAAAALARISSMLPVRLLPVARYLLAFPRDGHSVADVASALGINRKTLTNWCASESCPPPRVLITWCRLLLAAELLQAPRLPVEHVADSLSFPSASAFRNLCQRYFGFRPRRLKEDGAMEEAYRLFAECIASESFPSLEDSTQ